MFSHNIVYFFNFLSPDSPKGSNFGAGKPTAPSPIISSKTRIGDCQGAADAAAIVQP